MRAYPDVVGNITVDLLDSSVKRNKHGDRLAEWQEVSPEGELNLGAVVGDWDCVGPGRDLDWLVGNTDLLT